MKEQKVNSDRLYLYAASAMIDYASLGLQFLIAQTMTAIIIATSSSFSTTAFSFLLGNCFATALFIAREESHYRLLGGDRVSIYKSKGRTRTASRGPDPYDAKTLIQVIVMNAVSLLPMERQGWLVLERIEWSTQYWIKTYIVFYAMLLARDVLFMLPFHSLMHSKSSKYRWLRKVHQQHHEVNKNAQSLHA